MKAIFLTVTVLSFLAFGTPHVQAQAYGPYNPYWDVQYHQYLQWQQYLEYLRQTDPYYELHAMHYQLYLQPYQPYQIYQPCCYAFGIPVWSTPASRVTQGAIAPRPPAVTTLRPPGVRRK
jgi:hypothetical protein